MMPIKPENLARYPKDWPQIRERILARAGNRCEQCGVANYELGGRLPCGTWLPAHPLGERGMRLEWPKPGDVAFCGHQVGLIGRDLHYVGEQLRIIRIVLTIGHLDHTPENCADENLRAWCQRCHLSYDAEHHAQTAYMTRRQGRAIGDIFEDIQ